MSFNSDTGLSIDEQLRVLDLVRPDHAGGDLVMLVDNAGTAVVGDTPRAFPDKKPRLDITGYSRGLVQRSATAGANNVRNLAALVVVRRADVATASLSSLAYSRVDKLTVKISAYRTGGDPTAADTQPTFEIELADARIAGQYLMTGGAHDVPSEILSFAYRSITIRSAPQKATGQRGAVRECEMLAGT